MNRVRIADLKMLSGNTAVHSDMFTYHPDEPLEIKALQLTNTLFGVPQLSIVLQNCDSDELAMIRFYTQYWKKNKDVLLDGSFVPIKPLSNYPILKSTSADTTIIGVYDNYIIDFEEKTNRVDIINAQINEKVVLSSTEDYGEYLCAIYNCKGEKIIEFHLMIDIGTIQITAPSCGLIQLKKRT